MVSSASTPTGPDGPEATSQANRILGPFIGYTVVPILIALVGILAVQTIRNIGREYSELADATLPSVDALRGIHAGALRIVASTSEYGFIQAETGARNVVGSPEQDAQLDRGDDHGGTEQDSIAAGIARYNAAVSDYRAVYSAAATPEWPSLDEIVERGARLIRQSGHIVDLKRQGVAGVMILEEKELLEEFQGEFFVTIEGALAFQRSALGARQQVVSDLITGGVTKTAILSIALALAALAGTAMTSRRLARSNAGLRAARDTAVVAHREANQANRAKSEFLANMSHELRTPLHGILAFTEFGLGEPTPAWRADVEGYFERIQTCGQTLLHLLNELLDISKLEVGKMVFEFERTDVGEALRAAGEQFAGDLSDRDVQIRFGGTQPPILAEIDRRKMVQVFGNLMSNAIKFAPEGSTIDVLVERSDEVLEIEVRDRGPGIPEEEFETVFDKFVQSSRTASGAGGTGLGLAISRQIVEAHHGKIWARNHTRGGAVFSLCLPITRVRREGRGDHDAAA